MVNYYLVNTDKRYCPSMKQYFLANECVAAQYESKNQIDLIKCNDIVFIYENGAGIIACGVATGDVEVSDYEGDEDEQHMMRLLEFKTGFTPISPKTIALVTKDKVGMGVFFAKTVSHLRADVGSYLLGLLDDSSVGRVTKEKPKVKLVRGKKAGQEEPPKRKKRPGVGYEEFVGTYDMTVCNRSGNRIDSNIRLCDEAESEELNCRCREGWKLIAVATEGSSTAYGCWRVKVDGDIEMMFPSAPTFSRVEFVLWREGDRLVGQATSQSCTEHETGIEVTMTPKK